MTTRKSGEGGLNNAAALVNYCPQSQPSMASRVAGNKALHNIFNEVYALSLTIHF